MVVLTSVKKYPMQDEPNSGASALITIDVQHDFFHQDGVSYIAAPKKICQPSRELFAVFALPVGGLARALSDETTCGFGRATVRRTMSK